MAVTRDDEVRPRNPCRLDELIIVWIGKNDVEISRNLDNFGGGPDDLHRLVGFEWRVAELGHQDRAKFLEDWRGEHEIG